MQCPLVALWKHFTLSVMYLSMDGFLSWMDSSHTQLITVLTNLDFYVFVFLVLGIAPVLFPFLVLVNDIFLWDGGLARYMSNPQLGGPGIFLLWCLSHVFIYLLHQRLIFATVTKLHVHVHCITTPGSPDVVV